MEELGMSKERKFSCWCVGTSSPCASYVVSPLFTCRVTQEPTLDMGNLNNHLRIYNIKMLTFRLSHFIRPKDWLTSVHLKDGPHKISLKFAHQGTAYECLIFSFGLSLAPRLFSKCF